MIPIGVLALGEGGGRHSPLPPKILGNSDILGSKTNWGKPKFLRSFHVFFIILKRQIFSNLFSNIYTLKFLLY